MNKFDISFDGSEVLLTGQHLSGKLICISNIAHEVQSIRLQIIGKAKVGWTEKENSTREDGETESVDVWVGHTEEFLNKSYNFKSGLSYRCSSITTILNIIV